ncbi:hypothetical protein [Alteribacter keqinensis]|nr:hypothetical protein [Alteribacter keqinensis]
MKVKRNYSKDGQTFEELFKHLVETKVDDFINYQIQYKKEQEKNK